MIAISEPGYFLDPQGIDALAATALALLRPGGTVLACHWRRPVEGCLLDGEAVQGSLLSCLRLDVLTEVREADFILHVWSDDGRFVAEREWFDW